MRRNLVLDLVSYTYIHSQTFNEVFVTNTADRPFYYGEHQFTESDAMSHVQRIKKPVIELKFWKIKNIDKQT